MKLLVVNFHYFREEKHRSGIYPISEREFRNQLNTINEHYDFIGLKDLLKWKNKGCPNSGNYCLITFDDGLKEQMNAFEVMCELGIPGLFFVCTTPLVEKSVLEVHKLHYIRTQVSDEELLRQVSGQIGEKELMPSEEQVKNQYRYDSLSAGTIKYLFNFVMSKSTKSKLIKVLFDDLVEDEVAFSRQLYMNKDDLVALAKCDMLGAHGHLHEPLAQVEMKDAIADVEKSCQILKEITNYPIKSFAYPYGGKDAVNNMLHPIFKNTEVGLGFTMWRGFNTLDNFNGDHSLFLNRIDTNDAPGGKLKSMEYLP